MANLPLLVSIHLANVNVMTHPIDDNGANVHKYLHQELSVSGLNAIHSYLWMAGRMDGVRALHRQRMIKRDIVVAEDPGLHLLWYDSTIFVKPLPVCLLDYNFFVTHICPNDTLYTAACGFLRSYTLLIRHESDFRIAHHLGILPAGHDLRLSRVNLIYNIFRYRPWYYKIHRDYQSWFSYELGFMLVVFAYVSVVMSAMQVMLTTSFISLEVSALCYWAGIITTVLIVAVFTWQFVGIVFVYLFSFFRALSSGLPPH
ncbi:hypothetical protein F5J12DRAFT_829741 [Pisolithus orientalis]|uniref:uncharacterized protein n=1 Tax=Pisolithus orientalis TaxID=936130 RepID=UPI0022251668|nr:uncharacterized protein F5J12DRAFT_829741 [Pisolithus orientalis]KAI6007667.1 hypothetical protein F5J12DRAFT_829741 [Pisolithus orientalis]